MSTPEIWAGRCLCGAVRYAVEGAPARLTLCHCEDCQRVSGAPAVGWVFFPAQAFRWISGEPRILHWADRRRTFCPACGSPLTFQDPGIPEWIEVSAGTLQGAGRLQLYDHNWLEDHLPWLELGEKALKFTRTNPELPPASPGP